MSLSLLDNYCCSIIKLLFSVVSDHLELIFKEITLEQKQKTSNWIGIKGSEDVKEMQMLLDASFIFHGFGRFFSLIPPSFVAPLNLTNSHVAMLFDLAQAKSNCLRQQTDSEK